MCDICAIGAVYHGFKLLPRSRRLCGCGHITKADTRDGLENLNDLKAETISRNVSVQCSTSQPLTFAVFSTVFALLTLVVDSTRGSPFPRSS